jgi:hypothetical protein
METGMTRGPYITKLEAQAIAQQPVHTFLERRLEVPSNGHTRLVNEGPQPTDRHT